MTKNAEFRTIQSLGRNELIEELTAESTVSKDSVVKGIGDDTAVLRASSDNLSLLSSETYMEGVDFDLTYTPLHHLGYKVLSTSVSDIYAMNGLPSVALINLAVPNKLSVDMLKQIYKGIYAAGDDYGVQIVGGDLTASHQTLSINVSCTGFVQEPLITYRSGAQEDDLICVTGDLGGAIAGLRILMREKEYWDEHDEQQSFQPELEGYEYVVKRQLLPSARKDLVSIFHENNMIPHAMIDITQGLLSELNQISKASERGAKIYQAALPVALETRKVADEMQEDVDKYALYGGEDLELLFMMAEKEVDALTNVCNDVNVIGKIGAGGEAVSMQTAEGELLKFGENN